MVYGIDLGTTNSLIGVGDKLLSGMVPSIVDLKTRKAGESERYNWDTERGFKVNMDEGISGAGPRLCSSYVLTELKRQANLTGVIKAVISVPAYFNATQRQATMDAALMADIEVVKLINEPTAAALYITKQKPGVNIVFDLGGGTFDISVIETDGHKYRVLATDGRILGGNDFDRNLLDYLGNKCGLNWRTADEKYLSTVCDAKIRMQKERRAFTVQFDDLTTELSPEEYMSVMKATFVPAITLARNVMKDAGIEDATFNFVGGSTRCPYLREWVIKELNIQHLSAVDYNPDLVVAQGACMFADLYSAGAIDDIIDVSKFIGFAYNNPGNCILNTLVPMNMPVPCVQKTSYIVGSTLPIDECTLYFYQGLSCLSSECTRIGTMKFKFSELQKPGSAVINIDTAIDTNGCIRISCFEALEEPQVFIGGLNEDT